MAGYGYGYANFTSQPQQYNGGSFPSQNAATYGYAAQPSRVVQQSNYQAPSSAYGPAYSAGGQATVQVATTGGYGYFQRASEQNPTYAETQKTPTQQVFAYGTAKPATQYTGNTMAYQKPPSYSSQINSTFAGYTAQPRPSSNPPTYNSSGVSYNKPKPAPTAPVNKPVTHQNAYEKVVYNAATSFLTQQAQTARPAWQKNEKPTFKLNQKGSWPSRNSNPPKPQQLHYCEVCKISCAGQLTYKEHLEGQKHKKKANSAATNVATMAPGTYKCDLCEVICTGRDAFAAHIKGTNHTKTMKLHQKLGKPIPDVKVPEPKKPTTTVTTGVSTGTNSSVKSSVPKVSFVGGTKLNSTGGEEKVETSESQDNDSEIPPEGEPVGEAYIEDVKSDLGKVIGFKCTLCDCRFNDVVAKTAHTKGRRHRLSYKKKVDPTLKVDVKGNVRGSNSRWGRNSDERPRATGSQEMVWKQRQQEQIRWEQQLRHREDELRRWEHDEYMRRANEDRYWTRPDRNRMQELEFYEWDNRERHAEPRPLFGHSNSSQSPDDQLVMVRHNEIYPSEAELKQVQTIVATVEKALKKISDAVGEEDQKESAAKPVAEVKQEVTETTGTDPKPLMKSESTQFRQLKGVMRVGALAKGLLLRNQLNVELVVLCLNKPTVTLLKRVGRMIPDKLKEVSPDEKYNMVISVADCAVIVTSTTEPIASVKIVLTSPMVREEEEEVKKEVPSTVIAEKKESVPEDPKDVLDREKCLQALAALRHAKWFQARANQLASCVVVIRILKDVCSRVPAFKPLSSWAVELLCEKAISSYFQPVGPGEALRRVLEVIACGIFLPGGPGLLDPCEKAKVDAIQNMEPQEREDITAAAQHALRLVAFCQLYKVLGVEPLKSKRGTKRTASEPENHVIENKTPKKE
ncbi:zinc finger RNA-binding protein isoform X1 [Hydra vulgaris]|uniref:Zinc finger RNA-binding protein n=1 Tax=Hydra vulgaris TaxID=6087 RepID=T2M7G0_HYDVU|nr:zinc finger RNA-binding protein [Hydra vulgaris]